MPDVLTELEETAESSLEWLVYIAQIVRYRGSDSAWRFITEPALMTDEEAHQVICAAIVDATVTDPTVFARFKATRQRLEDGARRAGALFEAREGRPPRTRPLRQRLGYPPILDDDARVMVMVMAVTIAPTLPAEEPEDFDPDHVW
jgi:hypothetical protein